MSLFTRAPKCDPVVIPDAAKDEEFSREYNRVASKIGVAVKVLPTDAVLRVLAEEGIGIYPLAKVEQWMDKKGYWTWFALRSADLHGRGNFSAFPPRESKSDHPRLYGAYKGGMYSDPVPLPVLLTVERLIERFGDDARFFVAAPEKHPDPFLALIVCTEAQPRLYVIERWDEPGFRS